MHRVHSRTYVGQPNETVTVTTAVGAGGQAAITIDGQPVGGGQFQLATAPGASRRMQVALAGPQGASCLVTIAVVDGSTDTDFLLCTVFNPAPVHLYDFSTAATAAVASFGAARAATLAARGLAPEPTPTARRKATPKQPAKRAATASGKRKSKAKSKAKR